MDETAPILAPAKRIYRGTLTNPDRWATWTPRRGDILVCTPAKCGTTWTQTMIAMLLNGGPDLPDKIGVLSPWVDSDLGEAEAVTRNLAAQAGRRVVKTHTPADGFPVWDGVTVVAVYRHPLDVFFSLRSHAFNMKGREDHPMRMPVDEALRFFMTYDAPIDDFDRDSIITISVHLRETVLTGRLPDLVLRHYADMSADGRQTVADLARDLNIPADDAVIDAVAGATTLGAMRAEAERYAPEGGTGFWEKDADFFRSGKTGDWCDKLSEADLAVYRSRMAEILPDRAHLRWLEEGGVLS